MEFSRRRFMEMLGIGAAAAVVPSVIPEVAAEVVPVAAPEVTAAVARGPITHTVSMFVKNADLNALAQRGWSVSPTMFDGWGRISRGMTDDDAQQMMTDPQGIYSGLVTDKGLAVYDAEHEPKDGSPFARSISVAPATDVWGLQLEQNLPEPTPYVETARTNLVKKSGFDWRAEKRNAHKRLRA